MNVSTEEKKAEAIARMEMLDIFGPTIKQFEDEGLVSISEPPIGAFYWTNEAETEEVRRFEKNTNSLVYVIVRSFTNFGTLDCYLYVSDYKEEWEEDRLDLKDNEPIVYCMNRETPYLSEYGRIGIAKTSAAGLRRVY